MRTTTTTEQTEQERIAFALDKARNEFVAVYSYEANRARVKANQEYARNPSSERARRIDDALVAWGQACDRAREIFDTMTGVKR